jgi:uncharacterized membrane protein/protein-disulfide isomerase
VPAKVPAAPPPSAAPSTRPLLLTFAALGLIAASISTYVHHRLLTDPTYASFCDVNTTVSCTQAYLSRYGSLWGIPVAVIGVLFFALVLLLAGVAGRRTAAARDNVPTYVFVLTVPGLLFAVYLAWASFVVLKSFCIFCILSYVAVAGLFAVAGRATSFRLDGLPARARRDLRQLVSSPAALAAAVLFVAGGVAAVAMFPGNVTAQQPQSVQTLPPVSPEDVARLADWWKLQPRVDLPVPADGARVVVVKFNDYQCGACKSTHDAYKPIWAKHGASVKYVVKHFPLEPECNSTAPGGNHFASCEAAAAVRIARDRGTAGQMEEWVFANIGPPPLSPDQVREAARTVAGIPDFDARYPQALQEIRKDVALGEQHKVGQTPTFFINGRRVPILAPQFFNALIEIELKAGS